MAAESALSEAVWGKEEQVPLEGLLGLTLCTFDMTETVAYLNQVLRMGGSKVVFTTNVDHVVRFQRDAEFREYYKAADLVFADGTPLMWAARLLRREVRARVTGVDLMDALCLLAETHGYRCFFLGAKEATLNNACTALQQRMPTLQIAGRHHGYFQDSVPVLEAIRRARPHLLFVAMGSPRQEQWIARYRHQLSGVILPVGGSLEVIAGEKRRAPRWAQRLGLEWTWRLAQDPRRLWKRYLLEDMAFLKLLYREFRTR